MASIVALTVAAAGGETAAWAALIGTLAVLGYPVPFFGTGHMDQQPLLRATTEHHRPLATYHRHAILQAARLWFAVKRSTISFCRDERLIQNQEDLLFRFWFHSFLYAACLVCGTLPDARAIEGSDQAEFVALALRKMPTDMASQFVGHFHLDRVLAPAERGDFGPDVQRKILELLGQGVGRFERSKLMGHMIAPDNLTLLDETVKLLSEEVGVQFREICRKMEEGWPVEKDDFRN
jgi:hypothetical protein